MSRIFSELIKGSRRISRDEYASNFGNITDDVIEMLDSEQARQVTIDARAVMETAEPLPNGFPRLSEMQFGFFSDAPELERGEVAAIDGTNALPMQIYSAGQALSVGVGSLSHRRPFQDSLHYWSSRAFLSNTQSSDDFIARQEQGLFGISQTAYLRYFEINHGIEIEEPILFFDGPIVYEWLVATREGIDLYQNLFASGKQCIGTIKDLRANTTFFHFARALQTGEVYIIETLADHLLNSNVPNRNRGERKAGYVLPEFTNRIAPHILRGVFKPRKKAFGFEVHIDHLENMLRILAADCQMNSVGHEIPYLLNRVDEEVRRNFSTHLLQDQIAARLATQSEELFLSEMPERNFR